MKRPLLTHFASVGVERRMHTGSEEDMIPRRSFLANSVVGLSAGALARAEVQPLNDHAAPVSSKDDLKITKLETFLVKPRWLFLKIHTNAGIVGLGEPYLESRALASAAGVNARGGLFEEALCP